MQEVILPLRVLSLSGKVEVKSSPPGGGGVSPTLRREAPVPTLRPEMGREVVEGDGCPGI